MLLNMKAHRPTLISQVLKFISEVNPQNTPARLAFYNFLKGFCSADAELTPDILNTFFEYCLDYPHWASNRTLLDHEIRYLLENFNKYFELNFDLSGIRFPLNIQIVEIEGLKEHLAVARRYSEAFLPKETQHRLLMDQNKKVLLIALHADQSLEIHSFDKKFIIKDGQLEPLRKGLALYYDSDLELKQDTLQQLEIAPFLTAQFQVHNGLASGQVLRGYVFQKFMEFKKQKIEEQTKIYFPIKRIEQFFIKRTSDSYYQQLIHQIERTLSLLQDNDSDAILGSSLILNKAEAALEQIYNGDKLLSLLVRDLRLLSANAKSVSINKVMNESGAEICQTPHPKAHQTIQQKTQLTSEYDLTN